MEPASIDLGRILMTWFLVAFIGAAVIYVILYPLFIFWLQRMALDSSDTCSFNPKKRYEERINE